MVLGPQDGAFTEEGIYTLLNSEYTVSNDADRTGYRLEGPTIEHISGADIVSDGTALGSIQVPGGGTPIVLLADRGTTGGYTKIGTVISPDIGLIAQAMPGARIRFSEVSVEDARQILLEQERMIADIKAFVGLDLTGAFSMSASGSDFTVMDSDGRIVTSPGTHSTNRTTRQVSATVEGERFEFEIEVATL